MRKHILSRRYGHARADHLPPDQVRALLDLLKGKSVDTWHDVILPNGKHARMRETLRGQTVYRTIHLPITLRGPGGGEYKTVDAMSINARTGRVTERRG